MSSIFSWDSRPHKQKSPKSSLSLFSLHFFKNPNSKPNAIHILHFYSNHSINEILSLWFFNLSSSPFPSSAIPHFTSTVQLDRRDRNLNRSLPSSSSSSSYSLVFSQSVSIIFCFFFLFLSLVFSSFEFKVLLWLLNLIAADAFVMMRTIILIPLFLR